MTTHIEFIADATIGTVAGLTDAFEDIGVDVFPELDREYFIILSLSGCSAAGACDLIDDWGYSHWVNSVWEDD